MRCEKESSYQSVCDSAAKADRRMSFCARRKKTIPIYPSPSITDLYSVFFLPLFCFSLLFIFIISRVCRSFPPPHEHRSMAVWFLCSLNEFAVFIIIGRMLMWSSSNSNTHQSIVPPKSTNKNSSKQITIDGLIFAFFWQGFRWNFLLQTKHSTDVKPIKFIHHEEQRKNDETRETRTKRTKMKKIVFKMKFLFNLKLNGFFLVRRNKISLSILPSKLE